MPTIAQEMAIIVRAETEQAKKAFEDLDKTMKALQVQANAASGGGGSLVRTNQALYTSGMGASRGLDTLATSVAALASAGVVLGQVFRQALRDAEDERAGLARLQAVLESTGRSHEVTAGQIDAMAQALEDYANIDKQAVMDATAQLATYDNIASGLFERLLNAAADMSAVFGTDITSAVSDLGRVMEDPIQGLTRLRRQGIMISQEVQDQVTALAEQNRLYEAQNLILDEIEDKVGGVAEKIADISPIDTFLTQLDKAIGEIGNTISGEGSVFSNLLDSFTLVVSNFTGNLEQFNLNRYIKSTPIDSILSMDTGALTDYLDKLTAFLDKYGSNPVDPVDGFLNMLPGRFSNTSFAMALESYDVVGMVEEELAARRQLQAAVDAEAEAKEQAAQAEAKAAQDRLKLLEDETAKTEALAEMYGSTFAGQVESLVSLIDELDSMRLSDSSLLESAFGAGDEELTAIVEKRLGMYEAVIADLQQELDDLTAEPEVDTRSLTEQVLGMSAEDYVLNIPVSFSLDERSGEELLAEQLSSLESAAQRLYDVKPVDADALADWQASMTVISDEYDRLSAQRDKIAEQTGLEARAQKELNSLLDERTRAEQTFVEYQTDIQSLYDAGLVTQEQMTELLERQKETLGLVREELDDVQKCGSIIGQEAASLLSQVLNVSSASRLLTDVFYSWGDALVSGSDAAAAVGDVFGDFAQQLTQEMSNMFISAGLRCIIDGGWAGLGIGLALIAAGGLTGLAAGAMGGAGSALDDSIMESMQDELEARQRLAESINENIDTEYDLLKRQLERNLIDEEMFRSEAEKLQGQRDWADAKAELSQSVYDRISDLNQEYSGMSGWDRFWSGRDEEIKRDFETLQEYYDLIAGATQDELRSLIETLKGLGVSVGNVPAFATGGSFVTDGPQLILVGDNAGGRERVDITPLSASQPVEAGASTVIQLVGDVYGIEDLYGKLRQVGIKLDRRMRI